MTFEYGTVPPSKYDDVIKLIRFNFADEPLNVSVGLCKYGEPCELLEKHNLATLEDSMSLMAVEACSGEIAGVCLNGIARPSDEETTRHELEITSSREYKLIFGLLFDVNQQADLFKKFNVDKIFELRILCVNTKFRGKGLAKELFLRSESIAEENDFKLLKVDATSFFTQKVAEKLGYYPAISVLYSDFKDENGRPLYKTEPPHDSYKVMVKEIRKDK